MQLCVLLSRNVCFQILQKRTVPSWIGKMNLQRYALYKKNIQLQICLILVCSHLVREDLAVLRCTAVALVEASEALAGSQWWTTAKCLLALMSVVGLLLLPCNAKQHKTRKCWWNSQYILCIKKSHVETKNEKVDQRETQLQPCNQLMGCDK